MSDSHSSPTLDQAVQEAEYRARLPLTTPLTDDEERELYDALDLLADADEAAHADA